MLELKNVTAGYGGAEILRNVSVSVNPGEVVALIGPNGAGKSTVIKAVYGIARIFSGEVLVNGKNITGQKPFHLIENGIGYVNQGRVVFGTLTVKENLRVGVEALGRSMERPDLDRVYARFPVLREKENVLAQNLSGGQQQQLAIGRALAQNPSYLLLDEPSLGLSPKLQTELFDTILKLRGDGLGILLVEQNASRAIAIADKTCLLQEGRVALEGGREILSHPDIRKIYLGG